MESPLSLSDDEDISQTSSPLPKPPSVLTILSILTGLPIVLWSYKCLVMILFQRKLIYMPYLPFGARNDQFPASVPKSHLENISCEQIEVESEKGITLAGIRASSCQGQASEIPGTGPDPDSVIVYFQGNAGTPLLLIPAFQSLLTTPHPSSRTSPSTRPTTVLSVAPRSYWTSTRSRPTQSRLITDYLYILHYALNRYPRSSIVLFGHSLGAAAAVCLLSLIRESPQPSHGRSSLKSPISQTSLTHSDSFSRIHGVVLENPITSVPDMVKTLYPQKYLPYRYLAPFVWDKWDAAGALRGLTMAKSSADPPVLSRLAPNTLLIQSEQDELVPRQMGENLFSLLQVRTAEQPPKFGKLGKRVLVRGTLHNTAWTKPTWAQEINTYLESVRSRCGHQRPLDKPETYRR